MAAEGVLAAPAAIAVRPREAVVKAAAKGVSDGFYIPSLDGIRAAAVMLVFLAHAGLNDRVPGNFGVTAFFFLSGYLITTLLRMEFDRTGGVSLRAFYLRRVLRIFPPMYIVLLAASALAIAGLIEGSVSVGGFAAQALYLSNYYIVQNGWWDGRAPGTWIYWSLAVEEHFYLVFPVVYIALRRFVSSRTRQMLILLGLCGLVMAWRLALILLLGADHDRTYVASDTRVDSILFGCILAVYGNPVLDETRIKSQWWKYLLFPLGLLGLLVSFLDTNPAFDDTVRYTLQGLSLVPLFVVAIRFPEWPLMRLLNLKPVRYVGVVSYSIYLMHPTILFAINQWTHWHPLVVGVLSFGMTLGLATLMYRYVERPCGRLRKRLSRALAPSAA
ncbi:MAG: acyltransferase [Chloroflexi bacterium]|nr:acyltransferase [Chloroflexota bacterium]MBV9893807.1 acyltransferase [Chloroflexota bacterium]